MKKILITTGIYPPSIGGPATYSKLLFDELPKHGFVVSVFSFDEVRKHPKVIRHTIYLLKLFRKMLSNDVVFAQDTVSVGFPTAVIAKLLRKKFLLRVPGDYSWEQSVARFNIKENIDDFQNKRYGNKVEFLRFIQSYVANSADVVITPSDYFTNLVKGWVREKSKVITIYNGIRFDPYFSIENQPEENTIFTAGRLVSWKHFDDLIMYISKLPGWKLTIVGDGPDKFKLEQLVSEIQLGARVKLIGKLEREDLIKEMKKNKIFVLNSSFESFSFQLVEAMAAGLPIVCRDIGNLKEIVRDGESALFYDGSFSDFKIKIDTLNTDSLLSKKLTDRAKLDAQNFSVDKTIAKLLLYF